MVLRVPVRTQVIAEDAETVVADFTAAGLARTLLLPAAMAARATNQAPRRADTSWPGAEAWIWLRPS